GEVRVANTTIVLLTYFLVISLFLSFVFRLIPWLSLFLLLGFIQIVLFAIHTLRIRHQLINEVCVLLSD
ncbi:MAG: hypothetical protein K8I82_27805, partial [Anaerolineae bacterium]|nr:hypothetical protein [Anaerolineae bacterium]